MKTEDFLRQKKRKKHEKAIYTMVRLDRRTDLNDHLCQRCKELGCSKNDFFIALLDMDKEMQNGKK